MFKSESKQGPDTTYSGYFLSIFKTTPYFLSPFNLCWRNWVICDIELLILLMHWLNPMILQNVFLCLPTNLQIGKLRSGGLIRFGIEILAGILHRRYGECSIGITSGGINCLYAPIWVMLRLLTGLGFVRLVHYYQISYLATVNDHCLALVIFSVDIAKWLYIMSIIPSSVSGRFFGWFRSLFDVTRFFKPKIKELNVCKEWKHIQHCHT